MNKNKSIILVLVLLITITSHIQVTAAQENAIEELVDLIDIVEQQDMEVDTWQVRIKEQFEKEELTAIIQNSIQANFTKSYTVEENEKTTKYIYPPLKSQNTTESLIIVLAKQHDTAEMIYTMDSTKPDTFQHGFVGKRIRYVMEELFSENMTKLTCLTTSNNGNIGSDSFLETIEDMLRVQEIHRLREQDFIVMSGYTNEWELSIPVMGQQMNIQVAARNDSNGKTTFTLGTPILTNEY